MPAVEVARRTRANTLEYLQVFSPKSKVKVGPKWIPPGEDMLKINLDEAFTPGSSFGGWGVVDWLSGMPTAK